MAGRSAKDAKAPAPSARLVELAKLTAGGMGMEAAMAKVGYGEGCIAGLAPVMPGVLDKAGLTSRPTRAAAKPVAEAKETGS